MSLLTNPVLVSVVVLCVLCLLKLNVLMSLIIAAMTGAVLGGISIPDAMGILCDGFSGNANTALAYVLLGTFATAIASTVWPTWPPRSCPRSWAARAPLCCC